MTEATVLPLVAPVGAAMELRAHLMVFRVGLLLRAANRRRRRRLAAELSACVSHADLNDLHAILDTYPDGQTWEIRQILQRQQVTRMWTTHGTGRGGFAG